ncbi:formate dehydrogenase accessory protein FdhE [Chloroflexota bacterium]
MSEIDNKILERLDEWERRDGRLDSYVEFYRELLRIQIKAKSRIVAPRSILDRSTVRERLGEGIPLLLYEDFSPDWNQVQEIFEQVALWVAKDSDNQAGDVESLKNIARQTSLLKEVVGVWYRGDSLTTIARAEGIDVEPLAGALRAALQPFLSTYSRLLLPEVDQELWRRRYCPICGGKPDFAYLDKEIGARWLLCSRCDAEWLFLRLKCPHCGNENQDTMAFFTDEKEPYLYRLYVCEECHTYIKAIDLRHAESDVLLPLERVMTLDIDKQACEKGYLPSWGDFQRGPLQRRGAMRE